jgi:hypothetical protein
MANQFTNRIWTAARVEQLKQLVANGKSCTDIAAIIGGGVTRNSVIGKVNRLGMKLQGKGGGASEAWKRAIAKRPKKPKPAGKRRGFVFPQQPKFNAGDRKARILHAAHLRQTMVEPDETSPLPPVGQRVTFMELRDCHCRYPFGSPVEFFCGGQKVDGSSYCLEHDMLCRPGAYLECAPAREAA